MRIETTESKVTLIEHYADKGQWAVRWDFKAKDENVNWYEEEVFNHIPTIHEVQEVITSWLNKQTDNLIRHGFIWKGVKVLLNDENKFNYKAITDEVVRREALLAEWDKQHPSKAGLYVEKVEALGKDGSIEYIEIPTGRPASLLPIILKLGENNLPTSFYKFETSAELQDFFSAGVDHLLSAYSTGWNKIASFNWQPYSDVLKEFKK